MRGLKRFWTGLEAVTGLTAVAAEWQEVWGPEWEIGRTFLRLTDRSTASYPCPHPGGDGCPRRVVIHSQDDIVAVCQTTPRRCDDLALSKADIAIHELHWQKLGAAVAKALDLSVPRRPASIEPQTWRVGWCRAAGGKPPAVHLTIQHEAQGLGSTLSRLRSRERWPFGLAAPTASLCESEGAELLRDTGVQFLSLDECLAWDESGGFVMTDRAKELLSDLAALDWPSAPRRGGQRQVRPVDAPADGRWEELRLVAEELKLRYVIREKRGSVCFAEAGFEDRRAGGLPNDSWRLLGEFAKYAGGPLPAARDWGGRQTLKQRISKLRELLKVLFPLAGNPVLHTALGTYQPAFRIRPEDGITLTVPAGATWPRASITETGTGRIRFTFETPERYMAYSNGQTTEFTEGAERLVPASQEHDLWPLGFLEEDGEPTEGRPGAARCAAGWRACHA